MNRIDFSRIKEAVLSRFPDNFLPDIKKDIENFFSYMEIDDLEALIASLRDLKTRLSSGAYNNPDWEDHLMSSVWEENRNIREATYNREARAIDEVITACEKQMAQLAPLYIVDCETFLGVFIFRSMADREKITSTRLNALKSHLEKCHSCQLYYEEHIATEGDALLKYFSS